MSADSIILPSGRVIDFTKAELACRHCGALNYHPGFLDRLQDVRKEYGSAMVPTSGCRCKFHNTREGGHPNSSHICDILPYLGKGQLGAFGVDIAVNDNNHRGRLHAVFWKHGFSVGHNYGKSFIHADTRTMFGMPQIMFPY